MSQATLQQIIGAIGDRDFAAISSRATRAFLGFDLAAMLFHRPDGPPEVLFEDFTRAGFGQGFDSYARVTHRINPILLHAPKPGACRARDFRRRGGGRSEGAHDHIVPAPDEELGFRTVGWPRRLEEVGLYFPAGDGLVELSLYRARGRSAAPAGKMRALGALGAPFAAAFERHRALAPERESPPDAARLSPREREICAQLLIGCSSTAIALRLGISRHTVKDHRKQLFRKLGIGSLAELFALARGGDRLPLWRDG